MKKAIFLYPGGIINQNGNNMGLTLPDYGSVTPPQILQEWINELTQKQIIEWSDECDKWQKEYGHKKYEWKNPVFKKKSFSLNPFKKVWEVSCGDWVGGNCEFFRTLKEATQYAKTRNDIFVDIENEQTEESFRVRDMS